MGRVSHRRLRHVEAKGSNPKVEGLARRRIAVGNCYSLAVVEDMLVALTFSVTRGSEDETLRLDAKGTWGFRWSFDWRRADLEWETDGMVSIEIHDTNRSPSLEQNSRVDLKDYEMDALGCTQYWPGTCNARWRRLKEGGGVIVVAGRRPR